MDKVEIANFALAHIGVASIERLDQPSEAARAITQFYDHVRRDLLRKFYWSFAVRRVELALIDSDAKDFTYAYRYPTDVLNIRRLYNIDDDRPWAKERFKIVSDAEGRVIYTHVENACIEYIADVTDTSLFDELFTDAFSWKLAAEVGMRLTNKMDLVQNAIQAYNAYESEAQAISAQEDYEPEEYTNRLADARLGRCDYDRL